MEFGICRRLSLLASFLLAVWTSELYAKIVSSWSFRIDRLACPVVLDYEGERLNILDGAGPAFVFGGQTVGQGNYDLRAVSTSRTADGQMVIEYKASKDDFAADYTFKFKRISNGAIELLVQGDANVSLFNSGFVTASDGSFKQFFLGTRPVEAHAGNYTLPAVIYWPNKKLYIYCHWDGDWSNGCRLAHRLNPKHNFLVNRPPTSCDVFYALLKDGSRPRLKERFVICVATSMWEALFPVENKPSEFRSELAEMLFFDHWEKGMNESGFRLGKFALEWLARVTAGRMKFFTIVETWGSGGFDDSNPDAYRIPDHAEPFPQAGTKQELKDYIQFGKTVGRFGLRCNYMGATDKSWSIRQGLVKRAVDRKGQPAWYTSFHSVKPLVKRQETDIKTDFATTAVWHDQWASIGSGGAVVNFDPEVPGAGTICAVRRDVREICKWTKKFYSAPLGSESFISEWLIGEYCDVADFGIFDAHSRYDFTPEYKLRRLHHLTTFYGMGLGGRYFCGPGSGVEGWIHRGNMRYANDTEGVDGYRGCEILYGNGAYLCFFAREGMGLRLIHALTECFTVGVAQRYYVLQPVDYVQYGKDGRWKTLDRIIPAASSLADVNSWYKRFHIRYANGCHVWVNRDEQALIVKTSDNRQFELPKNGWLIYTEDGNLTAYTAIIDDPVVAGYRRRVDFCEDKKRRIRYVNPRKALQYMGVKHPTVWLDGKVHFVLEEPDMTFFDAFRCRMRKGISSMRPKRVDRR